MFIENGILVGEIGRSGAHQLCDKRRLAGKTGTGENQRMALPPDDPGVHEDAIRCVVGNMDHQLAGKLLQSWLQLCIFGNQSRHQWRDKTRLSPAE